MLKMALFLLSPKLRGYRSYSGYAELLLRIFSYVSKVTKLQKLRRLRRSRRASSGNFLLCLKSYEVTKVTMLFRNFQKQIRSYKVSEVTKVTQGFCFQFFQMSPPPQKKSKVTRFQKLQGYECFNTLTIFLGHSCKVTKLRGYSRNFRQIHPHILPLLLFGHVSTVTSLLRR